MAASMLMKLKIYTCHSSKKKIHARETANGIILNLQPCREDLECALEKVVSATDQEAEMRHLSV